MGLKETLNEGIKTAMKAKDQASLRTLRALKAAVLLAETAESFDARLQFFLQYQVITRN